MIAFQNAVSMGARHLETDIHVSADGIVHCFHDDYLERTTDGVGRFGALTASEIAQLDAGFNHQRNGAHQFRASGVRVPRFEEVVATFPEVQFIVDLKEDAVVEPFAELARKLNISHRMIVGSFSDERLGRFRKLTSGQVPTSTGPSEARSWLLASRVGRGGPTGADALQLPQQMRGIRVVDKKLVDAAHERGLQVHVWTVNEPERMRHLIDLGVDGLVTDRIDRLVATLRN